MSPSLKPLKVWGHWGAPNPWKVVLILEELNVPYDMTFLELNETKNPEYVKICPNGRLPTIHDPNTDLTLWESGAIILYLVEQYDKDEKISFRSGHDKHLCQQWLMFQVSGQGPYYGQATWFARFHPEKLPSAIKRYLEEIVRVAKVLDDAVARSETGTLVPGGKITYADLAFVTWGDIAEGLLEEHGMADVLGREAPNYISWRERIGERKAVQQVRARVQEGRAAHALR